MYCTKGLHPCGCAQQQVVLHPTLRTSLSRLQNTTVAKQKELSDAATAALTSRKIAGSWSAVRDASTRLTKTASSAGLGRVASLIAETASRGVLGMGQQAQEQPRQIPVIEQQAGQPPLDQRQQQQQQPHPEGEHQGPRQIPVIEMVAPARQQPAAHAWAPAAEQQMGAAAAAEAAAVAVGTGAAAAAATAEQRGPAVAPAQQEQQQHNVGYDAVLVSAGMDAQLAEAAMAQQAAAAPAGTLVAAGNGAASSPEHLYPPGMASLLLLKGKGCQLGATCRLARPWCTTCAAPACHTGLTASFTAPARRPHHLAVPC